MVMNHKKAPLSPWNPTTPMIRGNMATLLEFVKRTMQVRDMHLMPAIRHVLREKIGPAKYTQLLTSNVRNGTNDQKRLILRVAQAYARHKKRSKHKYKVGDRVKMTAVAAYPYIDLEGTIDSVDENTFYIEWDGLKKKNNNPAVSADMIGEKLDPSTPYMFNDLIFMGRNAAGYVPIIARGLLCRSCLVKSIDTINIPCGCETSCMACATHLQTMMPHNKCLECNHHIRDLKPMSDDRFRITCSMCGFCWDGNAQHICEAPERVILIPKQLDPVSSNPGLTHPVIMVKVTKAVELLLQEYASPEVIDGIWARGSKWEGGQQYEFQLKDEWFVGLQEELLNIGLELVLSTEQYNSYEIKVDPLSRDNINGRYGPDKDRIIRIPNYQSRGIFGDYDQEKVRNAVSNMPPFNWRRELSPITGNYATTLPKMSDKEFKIIKRKLKRLRLKMMEIRSTYFEIVYIIVPREDSQSAQDRYGRTRGRTRDI